VLNRTYAKQFNMKALLVKKFGGPEVLEVDTIPIPEPAEREILVKVMSCGVNPADTYIRSGAYAHLPQLPYIPGTDGAGVVEKVGAGVTSLKVGDRVWMSAGNGTYGQYCTAPENSAHVLPNNVSFDQGASLWSPYATAYHAFVHAAQVQPGAITLIHGASGGVGQACLQYGKHFKLKVIGTASTQQGLDLIASEGATAFNHKEDGYTKKISQATGGHGIDVVIEMLANVNLATDLSLIATKGCIVVVGNRGTIEINPRELMRTRGRVTGILLFSTTPEEKSEITESIKLGIKEGFLNPRIGKTYPLQDGSKAHLDIIHASGASGKVIIRPWD